MSYLIVDEADEDLEMAGDPFLEAGMDIPSDLPYQGTPDHQKSQKVDNGGIETLNVLDVEKGFQNIRRGSIGFSNIVGTEKPDETKNPQNSDGTLEAEDENVNKDSYLTPNHDVSNNSSQIK